MTNHRNNEYPANWHPAGGETDRPLHEGGYYQHRYYRVLPGSNQHVEKFLELVVDTVGMPPSEHALELNYATEDGTEVRREERLVGRTVTVEDRESGEAQDAAEEEIHAVAESVMADYADWTV